MPAVRVAPPDAQVPGRRSPAERSGSGPGAGMSERSAVTVPSLRSRKRRAGAEPLVMVTAYDEPGARIVDRAGVDIVLVGDSVANNVLGYEDTLHVTIGDMAHHVGAVARADPDCL